MTVTTETSLAKKAKTSADFEGTSHLGFCS